MMNHQEQSISELLTPVVAAMGYEFVGCKFFYDQRSALRVYIDHQDGIGVDDCSKVSKQISSVLDVEDPITEKYVLEVSSPGLERPLFKLNDFERFIGCVVVVHLNAPINGRRNFKSKIVNVEEKDILVEVDNEKWSIPFSSITNAKLSEACDE